MKKMNCFMLSVFIAVFFLGESTFHGSKGHNRSSNSKKRVPIIKPDWVETVRIDSKKYKKIYMTPDKLTRKFGKGLDLNRYKGYYYQAELPDIHRIADSIATDYLIDSVRVVDSLTALVYISKKNFILKYGIESLDPEDGEYSGFEIYRLPIPAPYLPIYPDYPKDKPEIMEKRTPHSRTFSNPNGSYTTILTIQPTSYPVKEGKEVKWMDISPDKPISKSVLEILNGDETLDATCYGDATEVDGDGTDPYHYCAQKSDGNYYAVVGAGAEWAGINNHLYERSFTEFSTTSIPSCAEGHISSVRYRTNISNADPNTVDKTGTSVNEEYK